MDKIGVFVWQPKNGSIGTKVVPIDSFPRARSAQKIWSQSRNQKKMPRGAGVSPSSGEEKEIYWYWNHFLFCTKIILPLLKLSKFSSNFVEFPKNGGTSRGFLKYHNFRPIVHKNDENAPKIPQIFERVPLHFSFFIFSISFQENIKMCGEGLKI